MLKGRIKTKTHYSTIYLDNKQIMTIKINCSHDEIREPVNLVPHPKNPNTHSEKQIELLGKIIKHQGWRNPVVVSKLSGFIVAGHGRLMAAQSIGCEEIPVDIQDFANEADELAHLVADNRIAELAEINRETLADIIGELDDGEFDLELTGFTDEDTGLFEVDEVDMPELSDGDKEPFQQKTFTLYDEQAEDVDAAVTKAKSMGHGESGVNENSNGNALAFICQTFNRDNP